MRSQSAGHLTKKTIHRFSFVLLCLCWSAVICSNGCQRSKDAVEPVRLSSVELTDESGEVRGRFFIDGDRTRLVLLSKQLEPVIEVTTSVFGVMNALEISGGDGKSKLLLVASDSGAGIVVQDSHQKDRIFIGIERDKLRMEVVKDDGSTVDIGSILTK